MVSTKNQNNTAILSANPCRLILASESPRRRQLLQEAGFSFDIFSVKVSENLEKNLTVDDQILRIAEEKAEASFTLYKPSKLQRFLFLSADTMVIHDKEPLGKPKDAEEAKTFLRRLSGEKHFVKTGIFLLEGFLEDQSRLNLRQGPWLTKIKIASAIETTEVFFKNLGEKEISEYIESGEPMDKAGAYGIQGLGGKFVEKIVGPFDNVVGLPMTTLKKILKQENWNLLP